MPSAMQPKPSTKRASTKRRASATPANEARGATGVGVQGNGQTNGPHSGEMSVEELAERTGVSVRNIRAYQTAGLMPSPRLQGRLGFYNHGHLGKLELIRDLRLQGFRLEAIKRMLDKTPQGAWSEYSLISELFSTTFFTVEAPQRKAIEDLAAHWDTTATPEQRERLANSGLYRSVGDEEVEMLSPALERIGIQLAELQVPLNTVLDLQDTLIQHTRAIAKVYVEELFLAMAQALTAGQRAGADASSSQKDAAPAALPIDPAMTAALKALFERLRPLAIGSISAAFPVVLQQEFDRTLLTEAKRSA